MLKSRFPNAEYYWMANWAHEIGKGSIQSEQTQIKAVDVFRIVGEEYCQQYGYTLVPLGDAWQKVRHDPLFYQPGASKTGDYPLLSLHSRIYHQGSGVKGKLVHSDLSHDGDVGGGQYLNACVWFEVLTKQSCVNMPFSPSYFCSNESRFYSLTAEQRAKLQAAAHETVHP
jgi:hypothetical protein